MLDDAGLSAWSEANIVGEKLSREDALGHPWKASAFEVVDEAFRQDRSLRGFLQRVRCGDAAVPLERSFQAPDDIFVLGDYAKTRAEVRRNFASLDGKRFFVRCVLSVPVEGYATWNVGLWIEVSKADHDLIWTAWNDPVQYACLRFSGLVANDVRADLDIPVAPGCKIRLQVLDADAPPMVEPPATGELADFLSREWPRAAFEEYAVARGFL